MSIHIHGFGLIQCDGFVQQKRRDGEWNAFHFEYGLEFTTDGSTKTTTYQCFDIKMKQNEYRTVSFFSSS